VPRSPLAVCAEAGAKRVFVSVFEWPGWCRSAKTEDEALDVLAAYARRYAAVPMAAGLPFPATGTSFEVVERLPGSASTDFGVPGAIAEGDGQPASAAQARRLARVVAATWTVLDATAGSAPAALRKGPRGGGRDRDAVVAHVQAAELAYARKIGVRYAESDVETAAGVEALRGSMLAVIGRPSDGRPPTERGWPVRYAARRTAWHALDHAWEIEDKS
jgi:hypothetical protein